VEDVLKRLIDAELKAEAMVKQADAERERIVHQAVREARLAEERFEARVPELRRSFMQKAEQRAEQGVAELERRYGERHKQLRSSAQEREQEAIDAAVALLLDPKRI
jgi:vacuolar-type H+-ATPase subunit H